MAKSKLHLAPGNSMKTRHVTQSLFRLAACVLLAALATPAIAQYIWLDEKGVKQYSDMPPPPSVPTSRILKQPGSSTTPNQPGNVETPSPSATPTLAEQNAAFKKRQQDAADKEKKAAEQSKLAAARAKNCDRTRDYLRSLESGERIAHSDSKGERIFLTDEQRATELRDARQVLADCNK
jgi:hypothetical protein